MPRISQAPVTSVADRHLGLLEDHGHVRGLGHLVEDRGHAAPGGVAHGPNPVGHGVEQGRDEVVQRGGVSEMTSDSMSSSPRASMIVTPWSPIGPDTIIDVARPAAVSPQLDRTLEETDAGGVDEAAVGLAPLHDLGVAGDDVTPAACAAAAMEAAMRSRSATGKPSSRMKPAER